MSKSGRRKTTKAPKTLQESYAMEPLKQSVQKNTTRLGFTIDRMLSWIPKIERQQAVELCKHICKLESLRIDLLHFAWAETELINHQSSSSVGAGSADASHKW
jgi:hypothetical protein